MVQVNYQVVVSYIKNILSGVVDDVWDSNATHLISYILLKHYFYIIFLFQVGWQLKKLVNALKKNSKEVTLTLKKRPRHIVFGQQAKRAKIKNLQQATFPKAVKRRSKDPDKGLRSPLTDFMTTTLPPPSEPFNER